MGIHYGHYYWCLGSSVRMIRCPDTEEAVQERDDPDDVGRDGIKPTKIPRTSLRMIPRAILGSRSD